MAIIQEKERAQVREMLAELASPVTLLVFTQAIECPFCAETRQLVEELAQLSDQVSVQVYDFEADAEQVKRYAIERIPAVAVVQGERDDGIRFYGIPSGYEFGALLDDILDVAKGEAELGTKTKESLSKLADSVSIQVLTAPTCPICPHMVRTAHKLAIASELIRADAIDMVEFPFLGNKYDAQGVPLTVINDATRIEGLVPEGKLMAEILKTVAG